MKLLPCIGNGLPADRTDELDGELLLLRINVTFICRVTRGETTQTSCLGGQ